MMIRSLSSGVRRMRSSRFRIWKRKGEKHKGEKEGEKQEEKTETGFAGNDRLVLGNEISLYRYICHCEKDLSYFVASSSWIQTNPWMPFQFSFFLSFRTPHILLTKKWKLHVIARDGKYPDFSEELSYYLHVAAHGKVSLIQTRGVSLTNPIKSVIY